MKSNNPLKEAAMLFLLLTLGIWGASNLAASGSDGQPDVVVQKHADGSVDVFDKKAGSSAQNRSPAADNEAGNDREPQQVNVHYRLKPFVGTRHMNGVSVRTNPDGTIETFDNDSPPVAVHHSKKASAVKPQAAKHK